MSRSGFSLVACRAFCPRWLTGLAALGLLLLPATPASALNIIFNGGALVINDNGVGDTNPAVGVLDFNSTVGSYQVQGTIDNGSGPNLASLIGGPSGAIRLTTFTATAIGTPTGPLGINFSDVITGTFTTITAADSLDAYVGHVSGAAVPPGTDFILDWQGYVSGQTITGLSPGPPPFFNPFLPPSSVPLAYTTVTHNSAIAGTITNPALGAYLTFQLGAPGDQLILYTSAELGFVGSPVPEPASVALLALGVPALAVAYRRRRRTRTQGN